MGDMREVFDDMREHKKRRHARNLEAADSSGWTKHTTWHWSRRLDDAKIDYWPTKNKWRYKGKTHHGDINTWLAKRDPTYVLLVTPPRKTNETIWHDLGYRKYDPKKFSIDFTKPGISSAEYRAQYMGTPMVSPDNELVKTDLAKVELKTIAYYKNKKPPWEEDK